MNTVRLERLKRLAKLTYYPAFIASMHLWRRWHPGARYVGITGSAGKTTTKDLLLQALGTPPQVVGNSDSNNQLPGVARTLLRTGRRTRFVVQETGASEPGGLRRLCALLRPDVGVVLNVGTDHFSAFGNDIDAVAAEKATLVAVLPESGLAVLNAEDPRVAAMAARTHARVVTFGFAAGDVRGRVLDTPVGGGLALEIRRDARTLVLNTRLPGEHHAANLLAAAATALELGVPPDVLARRLEGANAGLGRGLLQTIAGVHFIRDDLKAPAWSFPSAIEMLRRVPGARRWVVLGTMSDYKGTDQRAYRTALESALQVADQVVVVGDRASHAGPAVAANAGRARAFRSVREAAEMLKAELRPDDVVLLKGSSRTDHLARIALNLDRERRVECWRHRCGRNVFCDRCGLLGRAAG